MDKLTAHIHTLANQNGIKVIADLRDPRDANADVRTNVIHIGRTMTPLGYVIALHELGHIVHHDPPNFSEAPGYMTHEEISATEFAYKNSIIPINNEIRQEVFKALDSYTQADPIMPADEPTLRQMLGKQMTTDLLSDSMYYNNTDNYNNLDYYLNN